MNEELTQKIRNDFDRIALHEQVGWNHNNHYHHFLLQQLPSHCKNILEIGCGTGEFSRLLAKRADRVVAIDLSPNMIKVAKQHSKEFTNIDFQVADILKWEFPTQQFDAIASIATVHHLPVENLLPNLEAALKPGGSLLILDLLEHENLQDSLSDFIAVPLNWIFQILRNRHIKHSSEVAEAIREHLRKRQVPHLIPSTTNLHKVTLGSKS
ncbi:class I SAM-dependent methyltransferase [Brasilonema sp. UFV-L1]|uniref:class I SAM-dependent methyltransferase n=1 Tax=Brasilonema sp. UFV-L1 TaxID=2234130 RepID=UPI002006F034|nr:class I SAM-dependent methyltransferase [Brasilonema sp. UFV-L1]